MKFVTWVAINALALGAATWILDGITLTGETATDRVVTMIGVALVFGVINAVVRPVVKLLSLPFIILTLGLLIFVINAAMLLLTSAIAGEIGLPFRVEGFWTALWGAIIISLVSALLAAVLEEED